MNREKVDIAAAAANVIRTTLETRPRTRNYPTGLAGAALEGLYQQGASKLFILHEGKGFQNTNSITDIVAVHGFDGDPYDTWTAGSSLWLRDFLPDVVPRSRILSYGYSVSNGGTISPGNILHAAQGLLERLGRLREGKSKRDRPIIFICHSMGGVIVRKALLLTDELWQYERLRSATQGIVFLGTPLRLKDHRDRRDFRSLLPLLGEGASILRARHHRSDKPTPDWQLALDSIGLPLIRTMIDDENEFQQLTQSAAVTLKLFNYYETKETPGFGLIVPKSAANARLPDFELLATTSNHADLAKFSTPEDNVYRLICSNILRMLPGYSSSFAKTILGEYPELENDCSDSTPLKVRQYATAEDVPFSMAPDEGFGEGSYGFVWKAISTSSTTVEPFAIKQLSKIRGFERRDAVQKEIENLKRCSHPNILRLVQVYQIATNPSVFYLVTKPWAPFTLYDFIMESDVGRTTECPWYIQGSHASEMSVYRIFQGLIDGLAYMHNEAVIKHKDIKPSNILLYNHHLESVKRNEMPIIADLGVSKIIDVDAPTDFTKSTKKYLAPEQLGLLGKRESTSKADVFALGCCFALTLGVVCCGSAGARQISGMVSEYQEPGSDEATLRIDGGHNQQGRSGSFAKELSGVLQVLGELCADADRPRRRVHKIIRQMLNPDPEIRPDINHVGFMMDKLDTKTVDEVLPTPNDTLPTVPPELIAQITEQVIRQLKASKLEKSEPKEDV